MHNCNFKFFYCTLNFFIVNGYPNKQYLKKTKIIEKRITNYDLKKQKTRALYHDFKKNVLSCKLDEVMKLPQLCMRHLYTWYWSHICNYDFFILKLCLKAQLTHLRNLPTYVTFPNSTHLWKKSCLMHYSFRSIKIIHTKFSSIVTSYEIYFYDTIKLCFNLWNKVL